MIYMIGSRYGRDFEHVVACHKLSAIRALVAFRDIRRLGSTLLFPSDQKME